MLRSLINEISGICTVGGPVEIIPSIDLKSGLCVRLYQGDYSRETVYSEDPVGIALQWRSQGAVRLHVVDLDGAARGEPVNLEVIEAIANRVDVSIQVGGGIRNLEVAQMLLDMGVDRVVLGTAAVKEPDLVKRLCDDRGSQRVVVAVDSRDELVAINGWTEGTSLTVLDIVRRMEEAGVRRFLTTDISKDGTLTQPNFDSLGELVRRTSSAVLASGGVSSMDHIIRLAGLGVEGAVVGTALYTGDISLKAAIEAAG